MKSSFIRTGAVILGLLSSPALATGEDGNIDVFRYEVPQGAMYKKYQPRATSGVSKMDQDAQALIAQGRYDEAVQIYHTAIARVKRKSIQDDAFVAEFYNNAALAYFEQGSEPYFRYHNDEGFLKAIEYASQSILTREDYWPAYETLAKVFSKMSDLPKADYFYTQAEKYCRQQDPESKDCQRVSRRREIVRNLLERSKPAEPQPLPQTEPTP